MDFAVIGCFLKRLNVDTVLYGLTEDILGEECSSPGIYLSLKTLSKGRSDSQCVSMRGYAFLCSE